MQLAPYNYQHQQIPPEKTLSTVRLCKEHEYLKLTSNWEKEKEELICQKNSIFFYKGIQKLPNFGKMS